MIRTGLRIRYKSSLEYLGISVAAAGIIMIIGFALEGLTDYLENFDLGDGEELGGATGECS